MTRHGVKYALLTLEQALHLACVHLQYLDPTEPRAAHGLHILRRSAAKLRRDAGESVEMASAFLDHSSLAVTTTYLRRLEGVEDHSWERVADAIGV
jgi:hypothetical protein